MDETANARSMYDEHPFGCPGYDRARFKAAYMSLLERVIYRGCRLYDIGCGRGFWFPIYEHFGVESSNIIGLDQAQSAVAELQAQGYAVQVGDALDLPFDDGVADITVANGVIHHTGDSARAFSELVRITRPGGSVIVAVYNIWHPYFWVVHKATILFRYLYWHVTKKAFWVGFGPALVAMQLMSLILFRRFQNRNALRTLFVDQVLTPYAELFSHRKLVEYGRRHGMTLAESGFHTARLLRFARYLKPDQQVY
jgi:SAM-dependent methyltransferase